MAHNFRVLSHLIHKTVSGYTHASTHTQTHILNKSKMSLKEQRRKRNGKAEVARKEAREIFQNGSLVESLELKRKIPFTLLDYIASGY